MLHYQTLEPKPYGLLDELMRDTQLKQAGFVLAGGTALALQLGHRMSTDLDLFTNKPFDPRALKSALQQTYGNRIEFQGINELGFRGFLDGVKFDMIHFPYKAPNPPLTLKLPLQQPDKPAAELRMLTVLDLAAMKVHAIANRGLRRDFVDMAEILIRNPLESVLSQYSKQFNPSPSAFNHTMSAFRFFQDAERSGQNIAILNGRKWEETKQIILTSLTYPNRLTVPKIQREVKPSNPFQQKVPKTELKNAPSTKPLIKSANPPDKSPRRKISR